MGTIESLWFRVRKPELEVERVHSSLRPWFCFESCLPSLVNVQPICMACSITLELVSFKFTAGYTIGQ